jgi:hypothetical protein
MGVGVGGLGGRRGEYFGAVLRTAICGPKKSLSYNRFSELDGTLDRCLL